mmetsp:Transcript_25870/g.63676  ORF Transcript_25870/g.63676 Transcript_25870/m.63676 type:complete len:309 (-) Transcript_25870:116-1042(-)
MSLGAVRGSNAFACTSARAIHRLASRTGVAFRGASAPTVPRGPPLSARSSRRTAALSRRSLAATSPWVLTIFAASSASMASASAAYPKPIVVNPPEGGKATAVCIFLHGLGDTGHGWADVAQQMPFEGVKWIFPTAPTIPVTLNGGMAMTGWYDINDLSIERIVDDREMTLASAAYVASLVDDAIAQGVPAERIIVGGFSQGGVVALTVMLRSPVKLGGCAALSTYLALRDDYPAALGPHALDTPLFLAHGTADQVLRYEYGQLTASKLDTMGMKNVDFRTYPGMGHSACQEEFQHLASFISSRLEQK